MKLKWPETLPILTADDFCRGAYDSGKQSCLIGWTRKVSNDPRVRTEIRRAIKKYTGTPTVVDFNDDPENSFTRLARVWNQARRKLGFTQPAGYWEPPKP